MNAAASASMRLHEPPSADPRPRVLLGVTALAVAVLGLGGWAASAPIASAVLAPGVVTVDTNRKRVQHAEGGVVSEIRVRDGDLVEAGQILARLDETRSRASLSMIQARLDGARALKARLEAERDARAEVAFPEDIVARTGDEPALAGILDEQRALHRARRRTRESEVDILKSRIVQIEQDIEGMRVQEHSKRRQTALLAEELTSYEALLEKGHVDRPRLLALQREAARLDGERGEHLSDIARARAQIGETRLRIVQSERDFLEQVVDELRTVGTELSELTERLGAARHVVEHVDIKAPRDGVVVALQVHTVGGVVGPGDTLLEIVPADDGLVVEARVQPDDIDSVALGQAADVRFTAFKWRDTPFLVGELTYVSADRLVDPQTGEPYYRARVSISEQEAARLKGHALRPGMAAEVMIRTGARTAIQYLTQPLLNSIWQSWREE